VSAVYSAAEAPYAATIASASAQYNIPQGLLASLINTESGFNPSAVGPTNDSGIAQFIPSTAQALGVNPLDPTSSINGAAQLLAQNFAQTGNWFQAVQLYNGSLSNPATSNYANAVINGAANFGGNPSLINSSGTTPTPLTATSIANAQNSLATGTVNPILNALSTWLSGGLLEATFIGVGAILLLGAVYMFAVSQGAAPPPATVIKNASKLALAAE